MNRRLLLPTLLLLAGCGGGGGDGPSGPVTVVITSTNARDGETRSDGLANTLGGMHVGDVDAIVPGASHRAVVGFDLLGAGIPSGATIVSATLALQQSGGEGAPFTDLGNLLVDHVALGAGIDPADHAGNTLLPAFGVFSSAPGLVVRSLEVGARVQADLTAVRQFSDFRFRFATDTSNDAGNDYMQFGPSEDGVVPFGPKPTLTVTYLP